MTRFSDRHGFGGEPAPITVRQDAPQVLREAIFPIAQECGLSVGALRNFVCRTLRCLPDPGNWSDPNVWQEAVEHIQTCEWFRVYDIAEAIRNALNSREPDRAGYFEQELNKIFLEQGIGWQMVEGQIVAREDGEMEAVVEEAVRLLDESGFKTANRELHEARRDLSRRPEADLTGCLHHCMAAMESLCRELAGEPKAILGDILKRRAVDLGIPRPLDDAISKAWGYASEVGRHVAEGRSPGRREVALVLGLVAAMIVYLSPSTDGS